MKLPIPAWVGSVIFHLVGLLLLLSVARTSSNTRGAPGIERADHVGIVLKSQSETGSVYHSATETFFGANSQAAESAVFSEPLATIPTNFHPDRILPKSLPNVIGPAAVESGGTSGQTESVGSVTGWGGGSGGTGFGRRGGGTGSEATVGVFNLTGTGHKFAFVFDRSESMKEQDNGPIREAKAELIRAVDSLQSTHQLLIVFYNEEPSPYPSSASLIDVTDGNKEAAKRFIQSIVPAGGTDHEKALTIAARQNPDVIFLLTDGQTKDDLGPAQLDRITRIVGKTQINVIQFGFGPEPKSRNHLKLLATQNAGQYTYVNLRR
ncbi:MAG: VWA domain-containing protein [Planctomycetaceae bacterium]|nr:VWA domain-containing protein [Planctomycetaceae bacterium]